MGKHLPSIIFQNFRNCTWGMRPRVNVWSLVTARDLTRQFLLPFQGSVLQNTDHAACQYAHSVLYWSLAHNCRENQNDCVILPAAQAQCAELLKWPTYIRGDLRVYWISSRGQQTRGGPPAWSLGDELKICHRKSSIFYEMLHRASDSYSWAHNIKMYLK